TELSLKSVFAGIGSAITKAKAAPVPVLLKLMVYTRSAPAAAVPVGVTLAVSVTLGGVGAAGWASILLVSMVTAPFIAKSLPVRLTPVVIVILVFAITFPRKLPLVPKVADVPIAQNTFLPRPPLLITTLAKLAVVMVVPIWKMKTALGSPPSSRVSVEVSWADVLKQ